MVKRVPYSTINYALNWNSRILQMTKGDQYEEEYYEPE